MTITRNEILNLTQLVNGTTANFQNKGLTTEDMRILAEYLTSSDASSLKILLLNKNKLIGDEGGEIICTALSSSKYCRLERLDLDATDIGINTIKVLRDLLLLPSSSSLKLLWLGGNKAIGDNEVEILCSGLVHHTTLSQLFLYECNIGNVGALKLEHLLNNFNSTITLIDLYPGNDNLDDNLRERVKNLPYNNSRLNIAKYIPSHTTPDEVYQYLRELYTLTVELQIQSLTTEIPSKLLTDHKQLLFYLRSISQLLRQLSLTITDIPPTLKAKHQVLEYLQVKALMNTLEIKDHQIPKIFSTSISDQLHYLNELKRGKQSTKKLTIMVVGEEGVGKTSLIQHVLSGKWVGDTFDGFDFKSHSSQKQGDLRIPRTGITDGIDIHLYQPQGKDFILNLYDFAGQEIYYSTHQFVLSSQALYLLLFDASKSINSNRIAHWVHTLSSIAPGASVFLIGTHFDDPASVKNLHSNLSQLRSILDNIQFLSRHDRSLRFITPHALSSSFSEILASIIGNNQISPSSTNSDVTCPIWPIAISSKSPSTSLATLIQGVTIYAERNMRNTFIPSSWHSFRSILFPQLQLPQSTYDDEQLGNDDEKTNNINVITEELYQEGSYRIGIMRECDIIKYGRSLFELEEREVKEFIELLEYWGEIVYIQSSSSILHSLIILKPALLISLCKQFITAKKFNSFEVQKEKIKAKANSILNFNSPYNQTHFLNIDHLYSNVNTHLQSSNQSSSSPSTSPDHIKYLVHNYILPVLLDLHLIYPLAATPNFYLIPAMLRKPTPPPLLAIINNHPLLLISSSKPNITPITPNSIVLLKRVYEFIYLPTGMFTRFMMEVWKYFSLLPEFAHHLQHDDMFWEEGFIISDFKPASSSSKSISSFSYQKSQFCVIQSTNQHTAESNGSRTHGIARSIIVKVSCSASKVSVILPVIHRAIVNIIIHPLEFESGKNQSRVYCSAITPSHPQLPPAIYQYDQCFQSLSQHTNNHLLSSPPSTLIPYLIPEYFQSFNQRISSSLSPPHPQNHSNQTHLQNKLINQIIANEDQTQQLTLLLDRYRMEVKEVKVLGEGAGGIVMFGYWHSQEVAIKKPYFDEVPAILNEIALLQSLHHPNILKLLDVYYYPSSSSSSTSPSSTSSSELSLALVTEYCREGDLLHLLNRSSSDHSSSSMINIHPILICCILRDIAEGLSYLHNHSPPILHCDIRPPNIFIRSLKLREGEVCAVVGDVGFARVADPKTRTAGQKSVRDDVGGVVHLISHFEELLSRLINHTTTATTTGGYYEVDQNDGSDVNVKEVAYNNLKDDVDTKNRIGGDDDDEMVMKRLGNEVLHELQRLRMELEAKHCNVEMKMISERITSSLITPFFQRLKVSSSRRGDEDDIQREYEITSIMNRVLLPSPHFTSFQSLHHPQNYTHSNAASLLSQCISELISTSHRINNININNKITINQHTLNDNNDNVNDRSNHCDDNNDDDNRNVRINDEFEKRSEDEEFWHAICRYVIPILGYAIEQDVFTEQHLEKLDEIGYYYDRGGDFEYGLTLFHYACKSANLLLVSYLLEKTCIDINQCTYLPRSGSAAIHLAISSMKHQSNTTGVEGTMQLLDFLLSHGANINLRDNKGETALFKAAMEGSYQLVVHLLNYPQPVDIHILANERISAIVAAARYAARGAESDCCIRALLQLGSEYSPSLRGVITKDELNRIRNIARDLINDSTSTYARYPHSTLAIHSWLAN